MVVNEGIESVIDFASEHVRKYDVEDYYDRTGATSEETFMQQKEEATNELLEHPNNCEKLAIYCDMRAEQSVRFYNKLYPHVNPRRRSTDPKVKEKDYSGTIADTYLGAGKRWKHLANFFAEHMDQSTSDLSQLPKVELRGSLPAEEIPGQADIRFLIDNIREFPQTPEQAANFIVAISDLEAFIDSMESLS